jgi:hypothetical protein
MRLHIPNYDRELIRAYYAGKHGYGIEDTKRKKEEVCQ